MISGPALTAFWKGGSVLDRNLGVLVSKEEGTSAWLLQIPNVPSKDLRDV